MKTTQVIKGERYSRYTILEDLGYINNKTRMVLAICDCGTIKKVHFGSLKSGGTKSCGCYKIDNMGTYAIKHGLWTHPLYPVYHNAKGRCTNPKHKAYKNYGGRGINFYNGWLNDFKAFYDWAISSGWKKGLQLDRINNNKGYSPSNCRFVTAQKNNRNKRGNRYIKYRGMTKTIAEWSEITGLPYYTIYGRANKNLPVKQIFSSTYLFKANSGSFKPGENKH